MQSLQRVVITGLGAVTALGNDFETTWQNMLNGVCGVNKITRFDASDLPVQIAAEVKDFDPTVYMSRKDARRVGEFIQYAFAAAQQAVAHANLNLSQEDNTRIGVEVSSALGGIPTIEVQSIFLRDNGPKRVNPTLIPATLISMAACYIALELGLRGPTTAPVLACATGIAAVGEAARRIAWGDADVMLAGAAESLITPLAFVGFGRIGALSTRNNSPHQAITPFDAQRDGTVIGEGAAVLVLESLAHAQARGAKILAEVVGYGLSCDAYHLAMPDPEGGGASLAMQNALRSANLNPDQIDYVAAHGTGTVLNDLSETRAIKQVFGAYAYHLPLSSTKSMTGHLMGASGALSCAVLVKAMKTSQVPPTIGLTHPDPDCDLDYVPHQTRALAINYGMANAFGFGGQNASLVLKIA